MRTRVFSFCVTASDLPASQRTVLISANSSFSLQGSTFVRQLVRTALDNEAKLTTLNECWEDAFNDEVEAAFQACEADTPSDAVHNSIMLRAFN